MQSNYFVTEVSNENDLAQVLALWERNYSLPVERGMERYNWYYEANPYQKGKLFLLKLKDIQEAVGVGGVGYRPFNIKGSTLMGAMVADLALDKKHRALWPAMQLEKAIVQSTKKHADFLYGFPNKRAQAVLKRIGFYNLGGFTRLVKPLRSDHYFQRVLKFRPLAKVISIPIDFFLRLRSMKGPSTPGNGFHSNNLENSHSTYDTLWELVAEENLLMGERTSKFLDWRYFQCPELDYNMFGLKDNDNTLQGFIVYYLKEKQVHVVDLICPEYKQGDVMQSLFINFERHCFSTDANSISLGLLGARRVTQQLLSMGYRVRYPGRPLWIYTGEDRNLLSQFKDIHKSYWLRGDEDTN